MFLLLHFQSCIIFKMAVSFCYLMQGDVPSQTSVVGNNGGRRSKRLRTRSTKLDGRFQFDKKTKLLVGHPSPIANTSGCLDPEERFNRSLKKLKAIRFFLSFFFLLAFVMLDR